MNLKILKKMKTTPQNIDFESFEFVSNELQEAFNNVFNSLDDAIIIE